MRLAKPTAPWKRHVSMCFINPSVFLLWVLFFLGWVLGFVCRGSGWVRPLEYRSVRPNWDVHLRAAPPFPRLACRFVIDVFWGVDKGRQYRNGARNCVGVCLLPMGAFWVWSFSCSHVRYVVRPWNPTVISSGVYRRVNLTCGHEFGLSGPFRGLD